MHSVGVEVTAKKCYTMPFVDQSAVALMYPRVCLRCSNGQKSIMKNCNVPSEIASLWHVYPWQTLQISMRQSKDLVRQALLLCKEFKPLE